MVALLIIQAVLLLGLPSGRPPADTSKLEKTTLNRDVHAGHRLNYSRDDVVMKVFSPARSRTLQGQYQTHDRREAPVPLPTVLEVLDPSCVHCESSLPLYNPTRNWSQTHVQLHSPGLGRRPVLV